MKFSVLTMPGQTRRFSAPLKSGKTRIESLAQRRRLSAPFELMVHHPSSGIIARNWKEPLICDGWSPELQAKYFMAIHETLPDCQWIKVYKGVPKATVSDIWKKTISTSPYVDPSYYARTEDDQRVRNILLEV